MASQETSRDTGAADRTGGIAKDTSQKDRSPKGTARSDEKAGRPDWSHGLRQLYDSVVDEDLPDSFRTLLDKLDEDDPEGPDDSDETSDTPPARGSGA